MNIPLQIVEKPFPDEEAPGMMWRYPPGDVDGLESWWIVLPNSKPALPGYATHISWRTTDLAAKSPHDRWNVTGTPPNLTVTPSIDVECWVVQGNPPATVREGSYWHGFITNGELVT